MNSFSNPRMKAIAVLITVTATVCITLLFHVQVYAVYAAWKTPKTESVIQQLASKRGNIYDCNGELLAGTDKNNKRIYPQNIAAHVLGGISSGGSAQSGVELLLNKELSGSPGEKITDYLTVKGETNVTNEQIVPAKDGESCILTINSGLQKKTEDILKKAMNEYDNAENTVNPSCTAGSIVVLNAKTGGVLAMASAPDFSLYEFNENYDAIIDQENSPLLNRCTSGLYRPGSCMKTVTAYAALAEKVIKPSTYFFCNEKFNLSGMEFSCMSKHRITNVKKALELSCNIFFYKTSQRLGIEALEKYQRQFGLGEDLDFELPSPSGRLASPSTFESLNMLWTEGQLIQAAIGQSETQVTPLQMAVQAMTIGNKGLRLKPYIVESVVDSDGHKTYAASVKTEKNIIDYSNNFNTVIEGMVASTLYTDSEYYLPSLPESTAIKTGTPQSPRGYDSAVIGFYPADDPEIAFSVMLEGGNNAKNTVKTIIESYLESKSE